MTKKIISEIKKIIQFVELKEKQAFYLKWMEDGYTVSLSKKTGTEEETLSVASETGDYIVENIRSLDNSFKLRDVFRELENEGIY